MKLFDTHAHLLDDRFEPDRKELVAALPGKGLVHVLECACTEGDLERVPAFVAEHKGFLHGACGVHPHYAAEFPLERLPLVEKALKKTGIIAVGEIGLDYHYDFAPRDVQKNLFDAQAALSVRLGLPMLIHDREAHGDTLDILKVYRGSAYGIMHCFSGSYETAVELLDLGYHLGIGGSSTFKNSKKLKEMLPKLPLDRLVLETDCPYMTPEPFRGERNDPSFTAVTCKHLAELLSIDAEALSEKLFDNAVRLFKLEA